MKKKGHKKHKHFSKKRKNIITHSKTQPYLQKLNKQFIRFLIVGIANTIFSYSIYTILLFINIEYKIASLFALLSGIIFSFNTQGRFVFDNTNNRLFFRFCICWFLIYLFNIFLIRKFINFGLNAYISGAIAIVPVTLFSYFAQKLIVFRKNKTPLNT